jgi:hypothetical protein
VKNSCRVVASLRGTRSPVFNMESAVLSECGLFGLFDFEFSGLVGWNENKIMLQRLNGQWNDLLKFPIKRALQKYVKNPSSRRFPTSSRTTFLPSKQVRHSPQPSLITRHHPQSRKKDFNIAASFLTIVHQSYQRGFRDERRNTGCHFYPINCINRRSPSTISNAANRLSKRR